MHCPRPTWPGPFGPCLRDPYPRSRPQTFCTHLGPHPTWACAPPTGQPAESLLAAARAARAPGARPRSRPGPAPQAGLSGIRGGAEPGCPLASEPGPQQPGVRSLLGSGVFPPSRSCTLVPGCSSEAGMAGPSLTINKLKAEFLSDSKIRSQGMFWNYPNKV